jgi:hypothetical protein
LFSSTALRNFVFYSEFRGIFPNQSLSRSEHLKKRAYRWLCEEEYDSEGLSVI